MKKIVIVSFISNEEFYYDVNGNEDLQKIQAKHPNSIIFERENYLSNKTSIWLDHLISTGITQETLEFEIQRAYKKYQINSLP